MTTRINRQREQAFWEMRTIWAHLSRRREGEAGEVYHALTYTADALDIDWYFVAHAIERLEALGYVRRDGERLFVDVPLVEVTG